MLFSSFFFAVPCIVRLLCFAFFSSFNLGKGVLRPVPSFFLAYPVLYYSPFYGDISDPLRQELYLFVLCNWDRVNGYLPIH